MSNSLRERGRSGDKREVASVIEDLLAYPRVEGTWSTQEFYNLLGDYTELILLAGSYKCAETRYGISDPVTHYSYTLNESAVIMLSEIHTPISSNVLHKLSRIPDVADLVMEEHAMGTRRGALSFEPIRKLAREELKRRGNPPYRPSAYLAEDAYELCWFCGKSVPADGTPHNAVLYRGTGEEREERTIRVPRCSACENVHKKNSRMNQALAIAVLSSIGGCVVFGLASSAVLKVWGWVIGAVMTLTAVYVCFSLIEKAKARRAQAAGTRPLSDANAQFVKNLLEDGWRLQPITLAIPE